MKIVLLLYTVDDCTHGEIRIPLLGGADEMEGLIEVCVGGSFQPVILDNGRFSVREATAICRQLGLGSGMLFDGMDVQCIYIYHVVLYECHIYME